MANEEHLAILKQGVEVWNEWREENPDIRPDLRKVVGQSNARSARFILGNFIDFIEDNLQGANLSRADLSVADLRGADLRRANLREANFYRADLRGADVSEADLSQANFYGATLSGANFSRATLDNADLGSADLGGTNLSGASLACADLQGAVLARTNLRGADLSNCLVYGVSAWELDLEDSKQTNLIITPHGEPIITVDNLEVAQFIYLLLHNEKIRDVIDTITTKVVLILGRFTPERKAVLDAIRDELREHDYIPVLFDFDKPVTRDFTETVRTLAHLARFIIADITEPRSLPQELQAIVPDLAVPVQPLLGGRLNR